MAILSQIFGGDENEAVGGAQPGAEPPSTSTTIQNDDTAAREDGEAEQTDLTPADVAGVTTVDEPLE